MPANTTSKITNDFLTLVEFYGKKLKRDKTTTLQLNLGKLCNLTCKHCHVNAGPFRKEIISKKTIERIIPWFEQSDIEILDMTGGTPEMVPDFSFLVTKVREFRKHRKIIDRLNPTIINEPGYEWTAEFLANNKIEIIASMPCYSPKNVDAQRGDGVFVSSIKAFKKLNKLGYGKEPELQLNFVYNPIGDYLPGSQKELEQDYKKVMKDKFGIIFNKLFCLANMPIARFAGFLRSHNKLHSYMQLLKESFNPQTIESLMCRNTISVNWKGVVYDCDFNQMLRMHKKNFNIKNGNAQKLYLWQIKNLAEFEKMKIHTGEHCLGCSASSGSSCGGALSF